MRLWVISVLSWAVSSLANAADLTVTVRTAAGRPVADAVVSVYPAAGAGPARLEGPYRITQHDVKFDPFVTIIPVGAEVAFPNLDKTRHHVYSFSTAKTFELKLYGQGETRTVRFDKPGVVSLGCNIHDSMLAFIDVVDTPFAVKTNAQGVAVVRGLPGGGAKLRVWHPFAKAKDGQLEQTITLSGAAQALAVPMDVRPAPMSHGAY
jgi:plastocyanin